ncbi:MAG: hypothetical protein H6814_01085 [Phycisphaeraceae bacterium]|nr:hypothetical protein [Phycisphaeraceae bacterium]
MAHRITIDTDQAHDPPRWVAVDGLRSFRTGRWLGGALGLAIAIGMIAGAIVATRLNPNTVPLWAIGVGFGLYLLAAFGAMLLMFRLLKNADIRELAGAPEDSLSIHRRALVAGVLDNPGGRGAANRTFDAEVFIAAYQSEGAEAPRALIIGATPPPDESEDRACPTRLKGDPPFSSFDSRWTLAVTLLPLAYITWMIVSTLHSMSATPSQWLMFAPVFLLLWAQPLIADLEIRLIFPPRSAILDRGTIEFRKLFRRRTLRAGDAVCFIVQGRRKSTVQWFAPGRRLASLTLHLRGPDDPRLTEILDLWTADPISEPEIRPQDP